MIRVAFAAAILLWAVLGVAAELPQPIADRPAGFRRHLEVQRRVELPGR